MKIAIIDSADRWKELEKALKSKWEDYELVRLKGNIPAAVSAAAPDILITFDLEGFEGTTLTDGIYYNLLKCKQIHFILEKNPAKERFFQKPLSIAMFFYCGDREYYEYLKDTFPQIPFIKPVENLADGKYGTDRNAKEAINTERLTEAVCSAVREVMAECGLC